MFLWKTIAVLIFAAVCCNASSSNPQGHESNSDKTDRPSTKTNTINLESSELSLIEMGKADHTKRNRKRKPLLCVSFLKAKEQPIKQLQLNMKVMGHTCEWAAVFYDGESNEIDSFCNQENFQHGQAKIVPMHHSTNPLRRNLQEGDEKTTIVYCQRAPETFNRSTISIPMKGGTFKVELLSVPKSAMYHNLLPLLPYYHQVFVMDEDISLEGFHIAHLERVLKCVFPPEVKPLIVQPLIVEHTQYFPYVHVDAWKSTRKPVFASGAGLVEQQVPLFDAVFLEWVVSRMFNLTRAIALKHGVDQSLDKAWCRAAKAYGNEVLHRNFTGKHKNGACAVIVGGRQHTAVHHLNTRSLENKRSNRTDYRIRAQNVNNRYLQLFPTWVLRDIVRTINPLDKKYGNNYNKFTTYGSHCPA